MALTEGMAFAGMGAGSGLDRSAGLRGDPGALAAALAGGAVLALWRGCPLVEGAALAWLPADHPALAHGAAPVLLGRAGADAGAGGPAPGTPLFARDISDWSPEAGAEAVDQGFSQGAPQRHPALPESLGFADLRGIMARLSPADGEIAATAKALLGWHRSHGFCAVCGARSEPAQGGWQRNCPGCGAQHFPRTDPVVIMLVTRGNRLLLGRSPGWPAGMYSCLAGFVEPGETVEAAVRREVMEETGVPVGAVTYLASQPWPFPASLMLGCRGEALDEAITLDPAELEDARWVSREEMAAAMAGQHPDIRPARRGAIAHALIAGWLADRLE